MSHEIMALVGRLCSVSEMLNGACGNNRFLDSTDMDPPH